MKKTFNQCKLEVCRMKGYENWSILQSYNNSETIKKYEIEALTMFASQFPEYYQ
jgi:hypothetical protein